MARKASKQRIAAELERYHNWRDAVEGRIESIEPVGAATIRTWADDVGARILEGRVDICTQALIRSVMRAIEDFESGQYVRGVGTGFHCA